jgi:hypothetical protein
MQNPETTRSNTIEAPPGRAITALCASRLRGRYGLIALAIIAGVAGAWLGWPALVAAGIAPLLIAVLPCLVMCALGLCIMKRGSRARDTQSIGQAASDISADEPRQSESAQ